MERCSCGWKMPFCVLHLEPDEVQQYLTEISLQIHCPDCGKVLSSAMAMSEEQKMVSTIEAEEGKWNDPLRWESVYSLVVMLDKESFQKITAKRRTVEGQLYTEFQMSCYT